MCKRKQVFMKYIIQNVEVTRIVKALFVSYRDKKKLIWEGQTFKGACLFLALSVTKRYKQRLKRYGSTAAIFRNKIRAALCFESRCVYEPVRRSAGDAIEWFLTF